MKQYTPGPWKWVRRDAESEYCLEAEDGHCVLGIAYLGYDMSWKSPEFYCHGGSGGFLNPDDPDMRLIASAPTMADELRGVREWLRSGGNRMPQQWEIDHAITRISNALSEAGVEG